MEESDLLARIARQEPGAWDAFLDAHADTLLRAVRRFADDPDERMDLFLHVCACLKDDGMRRLRAFRRRPEAPARLSTYLAVVVKNLAIDHHRARAGRPRPFRGMEGLPEASRRLFEYHVRDGRPLAETRELLRRRHGLALSEAEAAAVAVDLQSRLSANQRWRLLARLAARRPALPLEGIDTAGPAAAGAAAAVTPEGRLQAIEAGRVFQRALAGLPPRPRLALVLRFRDGLSSEQVGGVLGVSTSQAERLVAQGVERMRVELVGTGVARDDLEAAPTPLWPDPAKGA